MPKIVNHETYSADLAARSVEYFFKHGYAGSSMRNIAQYLGVSKSALYHYFPSKDSLFLAATKQVMSGFSDRLVHTKGTKEQRIQQMVNALRPDFSKDLMVVIDYMRGKSRNEIANDAAMRFALETYTEAVKPVVKPEEVDQMIAQILGTLLLEFYRGEI